MFKCRRGYVIFWNHVILPAKVFPVKHLETLMIPLNLILQIKICSFQRNMTRNSKLFLFCRLKELGSTIEKKGISVSNVHSADQPLRLGQLQGNCFDIFVRDLKLRSNDSSASLKKRASEAIENIKVKTVFSQMSSLAFVFLLIWVHCR